MHHPRALADLAVEQGAGLDELLAGTSITPEMLSSADARISHIQFGKLVSRAIELTANPALGFDFGRRSHVGQLGLLGLAVLSSSNVREALEAGLSYYRSLAPAFDLRVSVDGPVARLIVQETLPLMHLHVFATESLLGAFANFGKYLLGREVPVLRVLVDFPRPAYAHRYAEVTPAPILYDQDCVEVQFDASILGEPVRSSDPVTARLARQRCEASLTVDPAHGLVGQVRRMLSVAPGSYPPPEHLARALQTSARTLRRGLHRMGTSYQQLLDEVRREHALRYVVESGMTVDEIAGRLGFSDVRSFRRAFKRWTGVTPTRYRSSRAA